MVRAHVPFETAAMSPDYNVSLRVRLGAFQTALHGVKQMAMVLQRALDVLSH